MVDENCTKLHDLIWSDLWITSLRLARKGDEELDDSTFKNSSELFIKA